MYNTSANEVVEVMSVFHSRCHQQDVCQAGYLKKLFSVECYVEDRLELVNTLADGNYFRTQHPHGQLCLTAAAWAGNGQVIKLLVSYGGLLTIKNLAGNTLLHSIILQSSHYPGKHFHRTANLLH